MAAISSAVDFPLHSDIEHKIHDVDAKVTTVEDDVPEWTEADQIIMKKALRKLDWTLVPAFGAIYMMSALDRSNIGNAALTTFSKDLGLVGNQYGAAVSILYATYVTFEPVFLLKVISPRYLLTASVVCWSSITIGGAFVKNYHQLLATRLLLGMFEASIAPCITLYLTMTYMRNEYVKRQTFINSCSALSGAFGGLLAYGLTQIDAAGLVGWQWMYLIEGLMSFLLIPVAWYLVPNRPSELVWLTGEESAVMMKRQILNRKYYNDEEEFSWSEIRRAYKDWRLYFHAMNHFGINVTLYTLTTFMPSILAGLGFTTRVQAQLLTVPVYFIAATTFIFVGFQSDKRNLRSPFMIPALTCNLIGYIMLATASQPGVRYAAMFISAFGLYISTCLNNLWAADNHAGHYKRAVVCSTIPMTGNIAGAVIGFVFTTDTAPRYYKGLYFNIAFTIWAMICTTVLHIGTRYYIKQKAKAIAEGAPDDRSLGDRNPHYQFFL